MFLSAPGGECYNEGDHGPRRRAQHPVRPGARRRRCTDSPPARARVPLALPFDPRWVHARAPLALRLSGQRARAPARLGAVHRRRQPPQLPRRRRARRRRAAADLVPRHAARVSRDPAAPVLSPAHRLDPGQPRAAGPRRPQARAARARRGPHRRHLPGGPVQPRGPARARPARRRADRAPRPACPSSPRRSTAPTRRSAGGASTCRARHPLVRPVRRRRCTSAAPAASPRHARGAGRGHPSDHGRDRGAPRRGARALAAAPGRAGAS